MKKKKINWPIALVIAWAAIFILCPLVYVFVLSFLTRGETGNIVIRFTFDNYLRIFDPTYAKIFGISFLIAFITALAAILVGYPFAYFAARVKAKYRFFIMFIILIPFWTSSLLRTYGWIIILQSKGLINSLLLSAGAIAEPVKLMYNYGSVLLVTVYMLLPFMILPIYNSVEKLDRSLIEASHDLGAGRVSTFVRITFPLTLPGIFGGFTLVFIPAVGLFFISDLIGGAKTMVLGNLISNQVTSARNWPFAAAISVVLAVMVIIMLQFYRRLAKNEGGELF